MSVVLLEVGNVQGFQMWLLVESFHRPLNDVPPTFL